MDVVYALELVSKDGWSFRLLPSSARFAVGNIADILRDTDSNLGFVSETDSSFGLGYHHQCQGWDLNLHSSCCPGLGIYLAPHF